MGNTIEKARSCSESLAIGFTREEKVETDDAVKKLLTKWVIRNILMNMENCFPHICVIKT